MAGSLVVLERNEFLSFFFFANKSQQSKSTSDGRLVQEYGSALVKAGLEKTIKAYIRGRACTAE